MAKLCLTCGKFLDLKGETEMPTKTSEKLEIKEALEEAETQAGNTMGSNHYLYYILKALTFAVCEGVDTLKQILADMPSQDNK